MDYSYRNETSVSGSRVSACDGPRSYSYDMLWFYYYGIIKYRSILPHYVRGAAAAVVLGGGKGAAASRRCFDLTSWHVHATAFSTADRRTLLEKKTEEKLSQGVVRVHFAGWDILLGNPEEV